MLVFCVYFRHFPIRSFYTRKRDKTQQRIEKTETYCTHGITMAFSMGLAMTWQPKATSARGKAKKAQFELMVFAMDLEATFIHFVLMAFAMDFVTRKVATVFSILLPLQHFFLQDSYTISSYFHSHEHYIKS